MFTQNLFSLTFDNHTKKTIISPIDKQGKVLKERINAPASFKHSSDSVKYINKERKLDEKREEPESSFY